MSLYLLTGQHFPCPSERAKAQGRQHPPGRVGLCLDTEDILFWRAALPRPPPRARDTPPPWSPEDAGPTLCQRERILAKSEGSSDPRFATDELCGSMPLCLSFPTLNKRSREDLPPCVWPLAAPSTQIPHFTKKGSQPLSEGTGGKMKDSFLPCWNSLTHFQKSEACSPVFAKGVMSCLLGSSPG